MPCILFGFIFIRAQALTATILMAKNFVYVKNSINFAQSLIT